MEIKNNSIIHTVRDYALEQFGVELTDEQISADLRDLNFSGTLQLTTALKTNDNDLFTKYITLDLDEGYTVLPSMDKERYQERNGLEGPFMLRSGKVVYYDATEGLYYDPDTDYYMSYEEYAQHDKDPRMQEAQSPGVVAQLQDKGYGDESEEDLEELEERKVAGAPGGNSAYGSDTVSTASTTQKDPNDVKQDANADAVDANADATDDNASAIEQLKKLAGIK